MSILGTQKIRDAVTKTARILAGERVEIRQRGGTPHVAYNDDGSIRYVQLPVIPDNPPEDFLIAVQGFLDHEIAHVLKTNNLAARMVFKRGAEEGVDRDKAGLFANVFEDVRIEREMGKEYPGAARNLTLMLDWVLTKMIEPKVKEALAGPPELRAGVIKGICFVCYVYARANITLAKLFFDKYDLWQYFKDVDAVFPDLAKQIARCKDSSDTAELGVAFAKAFTPPPPPPVEEEPEEPEEEEREPDNGEGDGDGEGTAEEDAENDENCASDEEDEGNDDEEPSGAADEEDEDGADKDEPEDEDEGADADGDAGDAEDEDEGEGASGSGDDEEEGEQDDAGDEDDQLAGGSGGEREDEGEDEGSDGGSDDDDRDHEEGDEDPEAGSEGGDGSTDEEEEAEDEEGAGGEAGDEAEEGGEEPGGDVEGEVAGELSGEEGEMGAASVDLTGFDPEDIMDMDGAVSDKLAEMSKSVYRSQQYVEYTRDFDVTETVKVPKKAKVDTADMEARVNKTSATMQKDLQRIITARSQSVMVPGFRRGRVNPSALHRLESDDDRIFRRKYESNTKDVAVQLVVDCSGSMNGHRFNVAMDSVWAFSSVLDKLGIKNEVIGFTTLQDAYGRGSDKYTRPAEEFARTIGKTIADIRWEPLYHPVFKGFEERFSNEIKERLAYVRSYTWQNEHLVQNLDGASLLQIAPRLLARREKRKLMIVFSDGAPCSYQNGHILSTHLSRVVKEIEKSGAEVIGVGISTDTVKSYYAKSFVVNNLDELPAKVMGELKRFLTA